MQMFHGAEELHLSRVDLDAALQEILEGRAPEELTNVERRKSRWAALAAAAGAKERVDEIAGFVREGFGRIYTGETPVRIVRPR